MSEMQIFSSARFGTIRTTEINGQPWFCLADVCKPLGLQSYHCKDRLKSDGLVSTEGTDSMGRTQMMTFIDEGNLYRTIFQSKKPEAEPVLRRVGRTSSVTHELTLPTAKAGGFSVQPPQPAQARSYTVSPSVSVRACPALPYILVTPTGAVLRSKYFLRRSHLCRGQHRTLGKSTLAQTGLLFLTTECRKRSKAGWTERSGQP